MRQFAHRVMLQGLCVIAFCLIGAEARAADATMFDQGQAQRAFTAIQDKVGRPLRVLTLTITPDALRLEIPNADKPGEVETWHVSHKGLAGALGVDLAVREGSARASLPGGGTIEESVIPIDAAGLAMTTKLAADALARARLQSPGRVTEMELMRLPKFLGPAARDPYWHIHVEAPEEDADISAKITGELTLADLRRTKRAETINLLAGRAGLRRNARDHSPRNQRSVDFPLYRDRKRSDQFRRASDRCQRPAHHTVHRIAGGRQDRQFQYAAFHLSRHANRRSLHPR